jgi:arylsulfatase A-like enzyme
MNVALVVLDSVRKDIFDEHAPRLGALADVNLDECRVVSSWSAPSHAAIVTGKLPSEIGIHKYQKSYGSVSLDKTIFDASYRCVGVSSNPYVNIHHDFDIFFDAFHNLHAAHPNPEGIHVGRWLNENDGGAARFLRFGQQAITHNHTTASLKNGIYTKLDDISGDLPLPRPIDEGTRAINTKIKSETTDEPWFVFANYMEAHTPHRPVLHYDSSLYDVPPSWSSYAMDVWEITRRVRAGDDLTARQRDDVGRFRELYAAAVEYLDRRVSRLIRTVTSRATGETMFVVTSDHGENMLLGDDESIWGHSSSMSEGLLHVPFVVIGGPDWLQDEPPRFFSHLDLRELVENVVADERTWPTRDRIPAELVGGGVGLPDDDREFYERAIRVVYDDPATKYEWDSLGNRNRTDWDDSVHELFADDIHTMKRRAMEGESQTHLDDQARSRLEDLGYV